MTRKHTTFLVIFFLAAATLACNLSGAAQSGLQDGTYENYQPQADAPLGSWNYSPDQQAALQAYGSPTLFTIIFGETSRHETWTWETSGRSIVFIDGEQTAEKTFVPQFRENMHRTTYGPDQFFRGMGIDDIVLVTGRTSFLLSTVEGVGRLMHLEGLSIGLVENRISFVETYPAATGPQLQPEDFAAAAPAVGEAAAQSSTGHSPTAEEAACSGSHSYEIVFYVDAEEVDRQTSPIEITFSASGLTMTENGASSEFTRLEENTYQTQELDGTLINLLFHPDGFLVLSEMEEAVVEVYYTPLD